MSENYKIQVDLVSQTLKWWVLSRFSFQHGYDISFRGSLLACTEVYSSSILCTYCTKDTWQACVDLQGPES